MLLHSDAPADQNSRSHGYGPVGPSTRLLRDGSAPSSGWHRSDPLSSRPFPIIGRQHEPRPPCSLLSKGAMPGPEPGSCNVRVEVWSTASTFPSPRRARGNGKTRTSNAWTPHSDLNRRPSESNRFTGNSKTQFRQTPDAAYDPQASQAYAQLGKLDRIRAGVC